MKLPYHVKKKFKNVRSISHTGIKGGIESVRYIFSPRLACRYYLPASSAFRHGTPTCTATPVVTRASPRPALFSANLLVYQFERAKVYCGDYVFFGPSLRPFRWAHCPFYNKGVCRIILLGMAKSAKSAQSVVSIRVCGVNSWSIVSFLAFFVGSVFCPCARFLGSARNDKKDRAWGGEEFFNNFLFLS